MPKPLDKPGGKNKSPEILDQDFSIDENTLGGIFVGGVFASDPDGDDFIYSIVGGNVDDAFTIDPVTGIITVAGNAVLDHESLAEYQLVVEVDDGKNTSTATMTITIGDVNEAPTDISLSSLIVAPDTGGAVVGDLSGFDPEGDALIFSINSLSSIFEVSGDQLKLKAGESLASGSVNVTVTVTDGEFSYDEEFTITASSAPPFSGVIDLGDSTAWNGFTVSGQNDDGTGSKVSSAGDVNGDGTDDVFINAGNDRTAFVVYGKDSTQGDEFTDFSRADIQAVGGFEITASNLPVGIVRSISSAGDINNDGIDDLILGFNFDTTYVIYGKGDRTTDIDLDSFAPGDGFRIIGERGWSVSEAGDVNGDGIDDLIIGAVDGEGSVGSGGNPNLGNAGDAYVIFGKNSNSDVGPGETFTDIDLATLAPADGFRILGATKHGGLGSSVSSAGDINNDGIDDLVIGATYTGTSSKGNDALDAEGVSYVIYGKDGITDIDLANFTSDDGFRITGADAGDHLGRSVSDAGDVNGDEIDDLIFGASGADGDGNLEDRAGESYVIFGKAGGGFTDIDLANLDPTDGIRIIGADAGDNLGEVSSAGDVNSDGIDDLLVSARRADGAGTPGGQAGEVYLIFGKVGLADIDLENFTAEDGIIFLGAGDGDLTGWSVSGAGDINNDTYDDLIIGTLGPVDKAYIVYGGDFTGTSTIEVASLADEPLLDGDLLL